MKNHLTQAPEIRDLTIHVWMSLMYDSPVSRAGIVDFGIDTDQHYDALRYAVLSDGVSAEQLDAALGNGAALTALIGPNNPYRGVTFRTSWDEGMGGELHEWPDGVFNPRFGVCPHCSANFGYRNVGKQHWSSCDEHQNKWLIGEALFPSWEAENELVWADNRKILDGYIEIWPDIEL